MILCSIWMRKNEVAPKRKSSEEKKYLKFLSSKACPAVMYSILRRDVEFFLSSPVLGDVGINGLNEVC